MSEVEVPVMEEEVMEREPNLFADAARNMFLASIGGSMVIITVLSTAASIVIYPMFAITEMLLYYDARVRSEGYDIEMMAEGL